MAQDITRETRKEVVEKGPSILRSWPSYKRPPLGFQISPIRLILLNHFLARPGTEVALYALCTLHAVGL